MAERTMRPPGWLPRAALACVVPGLLLLMWAFTGWQAVPLIAAVMAAAVAALALRSATLLVPRPVRDRSVTVAALVAILVLSAWASPWAVVLSMGSLRHRGRVAWPRPRPAVALLIAGAVTLVGGTGLLVRDIAARAARVEANTAAGDFTRGQLLPGAPD